MQESDCIRLRHLDDEVVPVFISYSSQPMHIRMDAAQGGSNAHGIAEPRQSGISLLPSASRLCSRRIADILSAYDDLIENNRRRMALLEEAARQLYREWFVRLRFPGHEHTRITHGVPEGWEKTNASHAMSILSGGTPKTSVPDFWDGDIPFYTLRTPATIATFLRPSAA